MLADICNAANVFQLFKYFYKCFKENFEELGKVLLKIVYLPIKYKGFLVLNIYLFIYILTYLKADHQREGKETECVVCVSIQCFTPLMAAIIALAEARKQKLRESLPHRWQGPKNLYYLLLPSNPLAPQPALQYNKERQCVKQ